MYDVMVKAAAELTPEESAQLDDVSGRAYADQTVEDLEWSDSQWFVLGKLDGRIVSMVGVLKREILVGGQPVTVGGVGGVATHPAFQRQGYAGTLMERAAAFMREELGVPFGLLVCADAKLHYYGKFGWQPMTAPMYIDVRGAKRRFVEQNVMILPISGEPWPRGNVDLQGGPW